MKTKITAILVIAVTVTSAQQNYNDFEGNILFSITYKSGKLNVRAKNPFADEVNESSHCVKYKRTSAEPYDNIKLLMARALKDVLDYSKYDAGAPKIKMKVYTSAPPGTFIEIQLGKQTEMEYPRSVHSQYQAVTSKQNEWEELEFNFSQIPKGSLVKSNEINQINILFAPGTKKAEIFYFDDLTGPSLVAEKNNTGKKNHFSIK